MKKPNFDTLNANQFDVQGQREKKSRSVAQVDSSECKPMSNKEYVELIVGRIEECRIDITSDEKDWVNILLGFATDYGESGRDYVHRICKFYVGPHASYSSAEVDEKYDWCLAHGQNKFTTATFIAIAKDYNVDVSMPPGRYPEGAECPSSSKEKRRGRPSKSTADKVPPSVLAKDYVTSNYQLRYNSITGRIEYTLIENSVWKELEDRDFDTIYSQIKLMGISISKGDVQSLISSELISTTFNPVDEFFDSLPVWNPGNDGDAIDEFFDILTVPEKDIPFYKKYARKWFLNFVALMKGQIPDNQIVLSLRGSQNAGKTFFCQNILPPALSKYVYRLMPTDKIEKDHLLALSSSLLVILEEFLVKGKMSNAYKAMITLDKINARAPYERFSKTLIRRASFVATGNDKVYIGEKEGNRRYLTFDIIGHYDIKDHPLPYERAYAQALYEISQPGFRHSLTSEEVDEITARNEDFTEIPLCELVIPKYYRKPESNEIGIAVSSADILSRIQPIFRNSEINITNIGSAMKKLGFEYRKPHNKVRYYVMEIMPEEDTDNAKAEGQVFHREQELRFSAKNKGCETPIF